ncbi:MAG: dephospho-CoA kinase [Clostridiaceae bacterium]|nr:dephospho-CoA kinase [Clostridiaceae bacterium]
MKIIGVTGGIGAGKTLVSSILKELGAVVIDADKLSREAVEKGKPAYRKIIEVFGSDILDSNRYIDRKKLGRIVFNNPALRRKLEEIVHEEVVNCIFKKLDELKQGGYKGLVVLDVPIPVEHGFLDVADQVWVVTAKEETRIKRVQERSGLSREETIRRMKSQLPQEDYIALADVVIENEGSIENLKKKVTDLLKK